MNDTNAKAGLGPSGQGDAHRVLIVGGGVAGLDLAGTLAGHKELDVALIDLATAHVWKPMLHSIAAGTHDVARVGVPYLAQARQHGFLYHPGRATAVDLDARCVTVDAFDRDGLTLLPERHLPYDTLVLAVGSEANDFGVPGVAEHARHIDTLHEAVAYRDATAPRLVQAAQAGRPHRVAIVGGGATGVQFAAELLQIADTVDDFGIDGARAAMQVTLLDKGDRLLAAFPPPVSTAARERLEQLGVAVRLNVDVARAEADALILKNGEAIAADFIVWAAGVRASPLAASLDALERGPASRIVIDAHCRTSRPEIFALGDCAALTPDGADTPLPPTAQVAFRQAVYLGRHLPAMIAGRSVPDFRYRDAGALVSLADYDAYGALGDFGFFKGGIKNGFFRGRLAQAGHALLYRRHQARLHGAPRAAGLWLSDVVTTRTRPIEKLE
ncbi:NAD(P)/FAD-dependent oxidoreductase [Sphingomonas carotinifaciens]|uniref:NAD(P)/FAD-dependent oxidoreductase n=1 Tax=Sphingomonas carotinifaciens TaxID=1166323 RepID=UPI000DDA2DAE|nr:FAD-dependent oxidoreductase [Sphingomonas carotinifaciens]